MDSHLRRSNALHCLPRERTSSPEYLCLILGVFSPSVCIGDGGPHVAPKMDPRLRRERPSHQTEMLKGVIDMGVLPVASRVNLLEWGIVASRQNLLETG